MNYANTDNVNQRIRTAATNRRLAQWRVTWLIEHSTSHQLMWCIDSFVLRNTARTPSAELLCATLVASLQLHNLTKTKYLS